MNNQNDSYLDKRAAGYVDRNMQEEYSRYDMLNAYAAGYRQACDDYDVLFNEMFPIKDKFYNFKKKK